MIRRQRKQNGIDRDNWHRAFFKLIREMYVRKRLIFRNDNSLTITRS